MSQETCQSFERYGHGQHRRRRRRRVVVVVTRRHQHHHHKMHIIYMWYCTSVIFSSNLLIVSRRLLLARSILSSWATTESTLPSSPLTDFSVRSIRRYISNASLLSMPDASAPPVLIWSYSESSATYTHSLGVENWSNVMLCPTLSVFPASIAPNPIWKRKTHSQLSQVKLENRH